MVLNDMRDAALTFIEKGTGDPRLGLFEYSALPDANPLDPVALAQANPNYNRRIDPDALLGDAKTAVEKGGEKLAGFKTESMCIHVRRTSPALNFEKWMTPFDQGGCLLVGDLSEVRSRVALVLDVSIDQLHASLIAAAVLADGRVRVEAVKSWSGPTCISDLRRDLPDVVALVKPRKFGWFPSGPAAAVAAAIKTTSWPPGVVVEELRGEVTAICMGFGEQIEAGDVLHSNDPLINAHVEGAEKLMVGEGWRFTRKGVGHVDATYGAAGATHLARTMPPPAKAVVLRARRPDPAA